MSASVSPGSLHVPIGPPPVAVTISPTGEASVESSVVAAHFYQDVSGTNVAAVFAVSNSPAPQQIVMTSYPATPHAPIPIAARVVASLGLSARGGAASAADYSSSPQASSDDTSLQALWRAAEASDASVIAAGFADGSGIVLGIPVDYNGQSKIVKRVIVLSAAGATFYVIHFIGNLLRGAYSSTGRNTDGSTSLWTATSSLMIELTIPACGYYGARDSNRQLTCCFCSCNLFITIIFVMSFIRLNIRIAVIDGQCEQEANPQQRRTCEIWMGGGPEQYSFLLSMVTAIVLGCLAFWFGTILYNRLAQDFSTPMPPALVGEVVPLSSLRDLTVLPRVGIPTSPAPDAAELGNTPGDALPTLAVVVDVSIVDHGGNATEVPTVAVVLPSTADDGAEQAVDLDLVLADNYNGNATAVAPEAGGSGGSAREEGH